MYDSHRIYIYLDPIYIPDTLRTSETKGLSEKGHDINVIR